MDILSGDDGERFGSTEAENAPTTRENSPTGGRYDHLSHDELIALLERRDARSSDEDGLVRLRWNADRGERDLALHDDFVTMRLDETLSDGAAPWDNLVIEGENHDALRWLRMTKPGAFRCIVVDPPYGDVGEGLTYNDGDKDPSDAWKLTTWLEHLHRRFDLARHLLADDGVLLVCINDENRAVLELMLDQTLPGMKAGSLMWRTRTGGSEGGDHFLSVNHEHILVYAMPGFRFGGVQRSYKGYSNPDRDNRGDWASDNLRKSADYKIRPNGFFLLTDPDTGISYPADPDQIWRYVRRETGGSKSGDYIEDLIEQRRIKWPAKQKVARWGTLDALKAAIATGDVPRSRTAALIRNDLPNLDEYVGKDIGFGTPRYKRFRSELPTQTQPLSSWITPNPERETLPDDDANAAIHIVSGANEEGSKALRDLFGRKVFSYPKPPSLIRELIRQATGPNDLVLDFYAGSGTAGQAVMELNDEDGGDRRFVLVSHAEPTTDDPDRNIARDVLAERLRLLNGKARKSEDREPAPFAYLRADTIPSDTLMNVGALAPEDTWLAIQASHDLALAPYDPNAAAQTAEDDGLLVAFVETTSKAAVDAVLNAVERPGIDAAHVYAWAPGPLRRALEGRVADLHALPNALWARYSA